MGLRIRRTPSRKARVITTIITAFALVAQPLMNVVNTANAISPAPITIVRPGAMNGWMGVDDNDNGGSLGFSASPAGAPLGEGSAQLKVGNSSQGYMLFKKGYGGTKLADLTKLSYKTYVTTGTNLIAPSVQINIDRDTTDADHSWQGRLVYEPYMNGTVHDGQWQTWNALAGKWWLSKADTKFDSHCGQGSPCTIAQLTSYFANIGVDSDESAGVGFKAGSSWNSFVGSIDDFAINQDRYDFEPMTGPELVSPTNNAIVNGAILTNKWAAVDGAVKYVYESYKNAAASQLRWHEETTDTQKSAANVANGTTFWWRVKAIDADGNVSAWSPLWKVTVDNVAPTVPTGGQPNGTSAIESTNEFDFTWNASTDVSPVTYEYQSTQNPAQAGNVLTTSLWKSGTLPTTTIHSSGAGDGVWYWQVRAVDAAGNKSAWSPIWQMAIDSQGPALNVTSPLENQLFGGTKTTVTVEATATDSSGLGAYYVALDGIGKKYIFHPANGDMAAAPIDVSSLSEGTHTILVRTTDMVGHATEVKRHIVIDQSAPTAALSSPIMGQIVGGTTLDLVGTVADPSGIDEYYYQLLNADKSALGSEQTGYGSVNAGTLGSLAIDTLSSGDYYVSLRAKDSLGNMSSPSYVKFTVDHTAPVVTLQSDKSNPMASSQVTFSGKVTNGADLDSLALYNGTVQIADLTGGVDSNGNWSYAFPPEDLIAGNYTFTVVAMDTSGNQSDVTTSPQSALSMSVTPFVPGRGATISPAITQQLARAVAIPAIVPATVPAAQSNDQAVLGTQTEKDSGVKGASDKLAAIAPTENGWKLFGIVWYWWLLILAAIALFVWRVVAWVRREDDVLPA
jgi:hypothetical protein